MLPALSPHSPHTPSLPAISRSRCLSASVSLRLSPSLSVSLAIGVGMCVCVCVCPIKHVCCVRAVLSVLAQPQSAGTALPNLKATLVEEFGALAFQVNRTMLLAELHRLHLHREERVQQVNGEAKPMNEKLLQLKRIAAQKMLFDKLSKRAQTASMSDEDEDEDVKVFSEDPQYVESAER